MGSLQPTPFKETLANKATFLTLTLSSYVVESVMKIIYIQILQATRAKTEIDSKSIKEKLGGFIKNESEYFDDCLARNTSFLYTPKIEGGDIYNLNCSATEENQNFEFDTLKCSIGIKYQNQCVNFTRTLLINPPEQIRLIYHFVLLVETIILKNLYDGMKLSEISKGAISFAETHNPNLAKHLQKEFGHILSFDLKDELMIINSNSKGIAKEHMVFTVNVNLIGLQEGGKLFNFCNSNTVHVKKDLRASIITDYLRFYNNFTIKVETNRGGI